MNFYGIMGQVSAKSAQFLKSLGFKNIASFERCEDDQFKIFMKNGLIAQIKYNRPGVRGIYWSVEDFKQQAEKEYIYYDYLFPKAKNWRNVFDEKLFEKALDIMVDNHNANVGVNWETVAYYLDKVCLKPLDKIYISLSTNDDRKITESFIVDKELLKILKKLKYNGGFLRFNMDIIKEKVGGEVEKEEVSNWLVKNVDMYMKIF